jgi:excisionase family DNA binding protein
MDLRCEDQPHKFAYRIDEAVVATGLGRSFLYEQMAAGDLKSVKIGGRRLILREDLIAFLHRTAAGPILPRSVEKKSKASEGQHPRTRRKPPVHANQTDLF